MKDISVKHSSKTETIDFGPVGRDILLDKKIEKETVRATTVENELAASIAELGVSVVDVKVDGESVVESKIAQIDSYHRNIILSQVKIISLDPLLFNPSAEDIAALIDPKVETIKLEIQLPVTIIEERFVWMRRVGVKNLTDYGDVLIFDAESNNFRQNSDSSIELYKLGKTEVIFMTSGPYANKCLVLRNVVDVAWQLKRLDNAESAIDDNTTQISQLWDKTDGMEAEFRAKDAELDNRIDNVERRGRYLALWNAVTGLPISNPSTTTYEYKPGDYYIVKIVAEEGGTNYRPDGSQYVVGQASTTVETDKLNPDNTYYYDGTEWSLQSGGASVIPWGEITGDITDQEDLSTALSSKVDLTSNQTITGLKTFASDSGLRIGTTSYGYIQYNNMYKYFTFQANGVSAVSLSSTALRPGSSSSISLGTDAYRWNDIHFQGQLSVNGSAGTAGQVLTSGGSGAAPTWADPAAPSNMVTTNTAQTISATKTFTVAPYVSELRVGSASGYSSLLYNSAYHYLTLTAPSTSDYHGSIYVDAEYLMPASTSKPVDLGMNINGYRFNNLHLAKSIVTPTGSGNAGQVLVSGGSDAAMTWGDAPAPSNMVTTDTEQTISAKKTITSTPEMYFGTVTTSNLPSMLDIRYSVDDSITYESGIKATNVTTTGQNKGKITWQWPGDLIPADYNASTFKYNFLGNSSKRWGVVYAEEGNFNSTITFNGNILPAATMSRSIGSSTYRLLNVYTKNAFVYSDITNGTYSVSVPNIVAKSTETEQTVTGQLKICVVAALPTNPDADTLYFIKES